MIEFSLPPDFDFGQQFDRVTLTRAMALNPEQAVLSMHTHGSTLLTRMQGIGLAEKFGFFSALMRQLAMPYVSFAALAPRQEL